MTRPTDPAKTSFAYVYDALYDDPAFLQAQLDFLTGVFGAPPGRGALLDVGCGTGTHVAGLRALGYPVVGTDSDANMLRAARTKLGGGALVRADLRRLPFTQCFAGALCLESPLAYLMQDEDLESGLGSIRGALAPGARLVIDVFDYPGTLGAHPTGTSRAAFKTGRMRVSVRESHRYAEAERVWTMRQEFEVEEAASFANDPEVVRFEVTHRLRIRQMDDYAQALEAAGFTILQALTAYPNIPEALADERAAINEWRMIFVARR